VLLPTVTSLTKELACAYRARLIQPTDPLPLAIRLAFIFDIMPANTPELADVLVILTSSPLTITP
jgi:hypothetical protein